MSPVVLSGSLDQYSAEAVKEQLLPLLSGPQSGEESVSTLMLDLSAVDHIDATGLQLLLSLRKGLSNKILSLQGVSQELQAWFRLAGADHLFEFVSSGI